MLTRNKTSSLPNIKKALKKNKIFLSNSELNTNDINNSDKCIKSTKNSKTNLNQRIIINSRGIKYDVFLYIFEKLPDSRLGKLKDILEDLSKDVSMDPNDLLDVCDAYDLETYEFYFNRDPYILNLILNYYINDKLHVNDSICVCLLTDELKYWQIDEYLISSCCQNKFFEKTDQINDDIFIENKEKNKLIQNEEKHDSYLPALKEKIWNLLENPTSSKFARIIQIISTILIILPTITYVISSLPQYDDIIEYFTPNATSSYNLSKNNFNSSMNNSNDTIINEIISPLHITFLVAEAIATVWFTLDYITRFICSPNKKRFLLKPLNIIDLIANIPFYINLIISSFYKRNDVKNTLRILQTLRIIRIAKHSTSLRAIGYTFKRSRRDLILLMVILVTSSLIISSLMFVVEKNQPDTKFDSIPISFYWGLITMTSVGYGDVTPVSAVGKVIASITSILGLLMISLPIAVLTKNFTDYYLYTAKRESILKNIERKNMFKLRKRLSTIGWLDKRKIFNSKESASEHVRTASKYSV